MKWMNCSLPEIENYDNQDCSNRWGPPAVIKELNRLADYYGTKRGMDRRSFIKSQMGMAASFLALNSVFGHFFTVDEAEASNPEKIKHNIDQYSEQFIFDVQVHYVSDDFPSPAGLLSLRKAADHWNPKTDKQNHTIEDIQFENFFREIFENSQTSVALLSNAPNDDKNKWFLSNEEALKTRDRVNERTEKRSLLAHAVITPGQPGWMDDLDRALELEPDAVKGYTLGDPSGNSDLN